MKSRVFKLKPNRDAILIDGGFDHGGTTLSISGIQQFTNGKRDPQTRVVVQSPAHILRAELEKKPTAPRKFGPRFCMNRHRNQSFHIGRECTAGGITATIKFIGRKHVEIELVYSFQLVETAELQTVVVNQPSKRI